MSKRRRGGSTPRERIRDVFVPRPFAGLVDETEWIALRELVPAATAPLRLAPEYAERYPDRPVTLASVLPGAVPAISKPDGRVLLGLQRHVQSGDVSRDLAVALLQALETEPGQEVTVPAPGGGWRSYENVVKAFWPHHRPATYLHRVIGRARPGAWTGLIWLGEPARLHRPGKIVTIVWRGAGARSWGFLKHRDGRWCWQGWKAYIREGGKHAACEGPEAGAGA